MERLGDIHPAALPSGHMLNRGQTIGLEAVKAYSKRGHLLQRLLEQQVAVVGDSGRAHTVTAPEPFAEQPKRTTFATVNGVPTEVELEACEVPNPHAFRLSDEERERQFGPIAEAIAARRAWAAELERHRSQSETPPISDGEAPFTILYAPTDPVSFQTRPNPLRARVELGGAKAPSQHQGDILEQKRIIRNSRYEDAIIKAQTRLNELLAENA